MGLKIKIKKPKITVGKPKVTIKAPSVTVGGDVGRAGDAVIKSGGKAVERFVKAQVEPARQMIEVVQGKPVSEALRDAAKSYVDPAIAAADVAAQVSATGEALAGRLASRIGGPKAEDFVADVMRLLQPYPLADVAAALRGIQLFIETGNLDALNPLAIVVAGEIAHARNTLWDKAREIPAEVINSLPEELQRRGRVCRYMEAGAVPGNTKLPKIAIDHLGKADAICLIDLIVFRTVPGAATDDDKFYWSHELYHAQQYADWGLEKFAAKYVAEELGGGLNEIEEDADRYACHFFPSAHPRYIGVCPIPDPPKAVSPPPPPPPPSPKKNRERNGGGSDRW